MRIDFASQISWQTLTPGLLSENSCIRPAFASDTYLLYGSGAGLYSETAVQRKALLKILVKAGNIFLDLGAAPSHAQSSAFQYVKDSIVASCRKKNIIC